MTKSAKKTLARERKYRDYKRFLKDDEDWDWGFILRLLSYKLQRTRKCIVSNKIIKDAPKVARQIQEVEKLLNRVLEDRYYDDISKDFHKKYGQIRMIKGEPDSQSQTIPVTFKYRRETPRNSKVIRRQASALWRKSHRMQRNDLKRAFNLMHKNIWGWWD